MFCALLTSRYQVSVYRTNGPLVLVLIENLILSNSASFRVALGVWVSIL